MAVLERCTGSPRRPETGQHAERGRCGGGSCRAGGRRSDHAGFWKMELWGMRVERLWVTVTRSKMER